MFSLYGVFFCAEKQKYGTIEKHFKITGVQNKKQYITIFFFFLILVNVCSFCFSTQNVFAAKDDLSGILPGQEELQQTTAAPKEKIDLENKGFFNNPFPRLFFWVLIGISKLIYLAVSTISFSLSDTIMKIFESEGLYTGWVVVRDFFNIFFIFFLIFSAFCTIFQVSKYHIRSTWIMIVVMALLVNFSWPLTRVMIDISNVTMVYILNGSGMTEKNAVKSKGLVAKLSQETEFIYLILGGNYVSKDKSTIYRKDGLVSAMLVGIIFGLIFLFTMVAIGILLLIRTILLAVLLVLSPVGFILMAFPSTRSRANQWWSELIDQLYVGPELCSKLKMVS